MVEGGREGNADILGAGALTGLATLERSTVVDMDDAPDLDHGVELMVDGVEKVLVCRTGWLDEAARATKSHTRLCVSLA
jgi:hypothetical protein